MDKKKWKNKEDVLDSSSGTEKEAGKRDEVSFRDMDPGPEIKYRQGDDSHYLIQKEEDKQVSLEDFGRILRFRLSVDGAIKQLGIKITDLEVGWARAEMEYSSIHRNPNGSVHGGMIFSLADSVAGTAACTHGSMVTTSTGSIYFLHAAFRPKKLIAEAVELKAGRNLMVYDVRVKTDKGKLVAKATMEYFNLNMPIPRGRSHHAAR